jgi:WD40 repeat protein
MAVDPSTITAPSRSSQRRRDVVVNRSRFLTALLLIALPGGASRAAGPPTLTGKDRQGDPLPRGALARLGTVRLRHLGVGGDYQVMFSADGRTLLSCGEAGQALWETDTGRKLAWQPVRRPAATPASARLLPDGKTLVTAAVSRAGWFVERSQWGRWDAKVRVNLGPRNGSGPPLAVLSADGKLLVTWNFDSHPVLWDTVKGRRLARIDGQGAGPFVLDLTPDNKHLVLTSPAGVHVYDTSTGKQVRELVGREGDSGFPVYYFPRVSPDGKRVAASSPNELHLWDLRTGRKLASRAGVRGHVAFSFDGRWLACSTHRAIHLFDAGTLKVVRVFEPHGDSQFTNALAFSPDGKRLARYGRDAITLFDVGTGKALTRPAGHLSRVSSLAFSPDGRLLASGGEDGAAYVWDLATSRALHAFPGHYYAVQGLAFSPNRRLLATRDGIPDGTGSGMRQLRLFGLDARRLLRRFDGHLNRTGPLVFSADGRRLATGGGDARVRLWDVGGGRRLGQLRHLVGSRPVSFLDGGDSLLVQQQGGRGLVLDATSLTTLRTFGSYTPHRSTVATVCGPGGRQAALATGRQVVWYDVKTGKPTREVTLAGFPADVRALSPDASVLAGAVSRTGDIGLWDLTTGKQFATLTGHTGFLTALAFSPEGRLLASGSSDTTMLVWDVEGRWLAHAVGELLDGSQGRLPMSFATRGITLLTRRLSEAAVSERRARKLIRDLDADRFAVRQKASDELEELGAGAVFALKRALESAPSAEVRARCQRILRRLGKKAVDEPINPARARQAVALLVKLNTPEARKALRELAQLNAETLVGREARQGLKKLKPGRPER